MNDVVNILHLYMARLDVTPEQLANGIGISKASLYNYFKHPGNWRLETLQRAYDYLRVPDDDRYMFTK